MSPDSPPLSQESASPPPEPHRQHSRLLAVVAACVALLVLGGSAFAWLGLPGGGSTPEPAPTEGVRSPSPTVDAATSRDEALQALLAERARAVLAGDRTAFLGQVDPTQTEFAAAQAELADRLAAVPLAEWEYELVGGGPGLTDERAAQLPTGSAIVRVRLTYRLQETGTQTDREQFFTVAPRGGRWLLAGDTDGSPSGFDTQRDLWDLGPVRVVRGESSTVVADTRGAGLARMQRLAREADLAVEDVDEVWKGDWSRRPVLILPRSQKDMATLIGSDGEGLAQIAAVTTGSFEEGLTRGDRVVINPAAFDTLGSLGRRVVLSHEMTHVATRATSVQTVPIWLSEGFADYVAYDATPVPTAIVAGDLFDDVGDGKAPKQLPDAADFDAGQGDVAAAYEGAWLACRMIAERYGEKRLVEFYAAMADSAGPGWPEETAEVLGLTAEELSRDWRAYVRDKAKS